MPQASDEQREEWGIDDAPASRFLESRGYRQLYPSWTWLVPDGHTPTDKEISAIAFLIDEWDEGGWVTRQEAIERGYLNEPIQ